MPDQRTVNYTQSRVSVCVTTPPCVTELDTQPDILHVVWHMVQILESVAIPVNLDDKDALITAANT